MWIQLKYTRYVFRLLVNFLSYLFQQSDMPELARENSKIYGVEQNIHFLCCDLFQYLPTFRPDVIFLSPPWGGPQYLHSLFNLESLVISGVNGLELVLQTLEITENVVYFLPRNTNIVPLYRIIKCPWEVRLLLST
jgi:hypothetical protein